MFSLMPSFTNECSYVFTLSLLFVRDSKLIIDGYLECLSSSDPEIVMSAAKLLSEISILAAGKLFTVRNYWCLMVQSLVYVTDHLGLGRTA